MDTGPSPGTRTQSRSRFALFVEDNFRRGIRRVIRLWSHLKSETKILLAAAFAFVVFTVPLSYLRHLTFQTNAWDLGIYMQSLWTAASLGDFFYYTAELSWNGSGSLFGVHFMPILGLLVPAYAIAPSAATLFLVQSIAVAASIFPLYHLMLRRTAGKYALGLSLVYLASPPLLGGIFFDFHIEAFLPVTTLSTWLAWESRRYKLLLVAMATMLSIIEFAPIILTSMGLMFLVKGLISWKSARKNGTVFPRFGLLLPLIVISLGILLTFVFFSIPKIISPSTPPLFTVGPLGGSLTEILCNAITNPGLILQALTINASTKALYLLGIWAAALGLWVLRPLDGLPALPWILVALLTAFPLYAYPASNQYGFFVVPFLFPATAAGLQAVILRRQRQDVRTDMRDPVPRARVVRRGKIMGTLRNPVLAFLIVLLLSSQLALNPMSPLSFSWQGVGRLPGEHEMTVKAVLGLIPATASVSAQPDLFPHVANRRSAYPYLVPGVEYVIIDLKSWWFISRLPPPTTNPPWIEQLRENVTGTYGLVASADGVELFQWGYTGLPFFFIPFKATAAPDRFAAQEVALVRDQESPMGSYFTIRQTSPNASLWFGPSFLLPPGQYELRIWLKEETATNGSIRLNATIDAGQKTLASWEVASGDVHTSWTSMRRTVDIPYPGFFELSGYSVRLPTAIQFGGIEITQILQPVTLGG